MEEKNIIFEKLTPISDADISIYKDALDYVFSDNDIKIIGVTGAYGSGKTSVIETYKKETNRSDFIHISLADFKENCIPDMKIKKSETQEHQDQREEKIFSEDYNSRDASVIEGKIINQLLHQIKPEKIPQTAFKLKTKIKKKWIALISGGVSIFTGCLLYLTNYGKWKALISDIPIEEQSSFLAKTILPANIIVLAIIMLVLVLLATIGIVWLITNKKILKKISIQGNEIEILETNEESYFDKYMNEVLYLFENSGAQVFVFEDLDRYEKGRIFTRLREINHLLNIKIASPKETIKFIFLLRDDMFKTKDRTKFFDFIIPIVPVVDGSNSYNKLKTYLEERRVFHLFNRYFLQQVCIYVDDMRILKNICNEYMVYKNKVGNIGQNDDQLLAMIIYKNFFPEDFSNLQVNQGYVYSLFKKKDVNVNLKMLKKWKIKMYSLFHTNSLLEVPGVNVFPSVGMTAP